MKFKEFEIVRLVNPLPNLDIPVGAKGVIVVVYDLTHYEVEFINNENETIGLATVDEENLCQY